ncbi:MAG TPA: phosphatase PAP2 family protein [Pseudonocardia sp.]|jgi:membrane-associated phospholipid phosphatase
MSLRPTVAPPGPLLPGPWRTAVAVLVPLCVLGTAALGWWYGGTREAGRLDTVLGAPLTALAAGREDAFWPLADLGSPPALLLALVVLAVSVGRGRWPRLALAMGGPLLAVVLAEFVLKPLVGRTHDGGLSLPSGHTTSITSLAWVFVVLFVAGGPPRPAWLRVLLTGVAGAAVVAVGGSMVALERHYATDTLAGALLGTAVVGALAWVLDLRSRTDAGG